MRIAVLGATGGTGAAVVRLALERGHHVTALARRPDAVHVVHDLLSVVRADAFDPASIAAGIAGADAVVSALGVGSARVPTTVYSSGIGHVLTAMEGAGIRRIVAVSAGPVGDDSGASFVERRLVKPLLWRFFGASYADMRVMEGELRSSHTRWTVFRPPRLTDKPATGFVRAAVDTHLGRMGTITRADLASAILDAIDRGAAIGKVVEISN